MIAWLDRTLRFPPLAAALHEPNGLLAVGGDLAPQRLLEAYRRGIFPWYSPGDPILWWSPDPRMVLFPGELKISRSLTKTLRNKAYEVRFDTAFEAVIGACAAPRNGESGTWIVQDIQEAYVRLHALGYAHSVETWIDGELAGGLYGVAIGRMFYGESMFAVARDASKIALVHLVRHLAARDYGMIDCQMETPHLATLGARPLPRTEFARRLEELIHCSHEAGPWHVGPMHDGELIKARTAP